MPTTPDTTNPTDAPLTGTPAFNPPPDARLTTAEAGRYLGQFRTDDDGEGAPISQGRMRQMYMQGRMPHTIKVGRDLLFLRSDLDDPTLRERKTGRAPGYKREVTPVPAKRVSPVPAKRTQPRTAPPVKIATAVPNGETWLIRDRPARRMSAGRR